jgi:hypothetical protein
MLGVGCQNKAPSRRPLPEGEGELVEGNEPKMRALRGFANLAFGNPGLTHVRLYDDVASGLKRVQNPARSCDGQGFWK